VDSMHLNVHHSPFVRREIRYMIYALYMGRKTAGGGGQWEEGVGGCRGEEYFKSKQPLSF
jgi:hypothetical protein